jgi:hypothetical protein
MNAIHTELLTQPTQTWKAEGLSPEELAECEREQAQGRAAAETFCQALSDRPSCERAAVLAKMRAVFDSVPGDCDAVGFAIGFGRALQGWPSHAR